MDIGPHFKRAILARGIATQIELILFPADDAPPLPEEMRVEVEFAGGALGREVCVARNIEQGKRWYIVTLTPAHFPSLCDALIRPSNMVGENPSSQAPTVTALTLRFQNGHEVQLECSQDPLFFESHAPQSATSN